MTEESHNPYFNRWFSAMQDMILLQTVHSGHNPYFNRWFSAITKVIDDNFNCPLSQSLF